MAEGGRAVANVLPRGLRLGLGGLAGFLDFFAGRLGAADHRLADAFRGVRDTLADLLGAALDLPRALLGFGVLRGLRVIGRPRGPGCEQCQRQEQDCKTCQGFHLDILLSTSISFSPPSRGRLFRRVYPQLACQRPRLHR